MCQNCSNKSCGSCGGSSADGTENYDPALIAQWIQKYLLPQGSVDEVKTAYPKVMIYFEAKGITPSEENIVSYAQDITMAIQDPLFMEKIQKIAEEKKSGSFIQSVKPMIGLLVLGLIVIAILMNLKNA